MANFPGTAGNDTYNGTSDADTIKGLGGNDILNGNGGNDTIDGGAGIDTIHGNDGNDVITMGRGDTVHGDDGDDEINFASADLDSGSASVNGEIGTDKLTLDFTGVVDAVTGFNYGDGSGYTGFVSYNGIESLWITGGSASDILYGGIGDDRLLGGKGNDRLLAGFGHNVINGGGGSDIGLIDLSADNVGRTITFASNVNLTVAGNTLTNVEGIGLKLGGGNDIVDVTDETIGSEIYTGGGNDRVTGGAGFDFIDTGIGNDKIYVDRGDTVHAQDNDDLIFITSDQAIGNSASLFGEAGIDKLTIDLSGAFDAMSSFNYQDGSGYIAGINYSGIENLVISGGSGSDTVHGGTGTDTLNGNGGNDRLDGHGGNNTIDGGTGNDIGLVDMSALAGARTVTFVSGVALSIGFNDLSNIEGLGLKTGAGNDVIDVSGETIGSELYANGGNDTLTGGVAFDILDGGQGDDTITFGRGDIVHGQDGDDEFFATLNSNVGSGSTVYGENNNDTLTIDFTETPDALSSFNYGDGSGYIAGINYSGIESLVLTGGTASDVIYGGLGDDTLNGGTGNDTIDGEKGDNTIDGGAGKDIGLVDLSDTTAALNIVFHNTTANTIGVNSLIRVEGLGFKGGTGNDKVDVSAETIGSKIYGGDGKDTLTGGAAADFLDGGLLDDIIRGGIGDTVHGQDGNDALTYTSLTVVGTGAGFSGEAGTDTLTIDYSDYTEGSLTSFNYGDGSGYVTGVNYNGIENLVILGGTGNDTLMAGINADTIDGGGGDDILIGGNGKDTLAGGTGSDHFKWSALIDSTVAGTGRDVVSQYDGSDKFDLTGLETATGHTFSFIGTDTFNNVAGEIRYGASGADTLVSIDTDGNGAADFAFLVNGAHTFATGDFML